MKGDFVKVARQDKARTNVKQEDGCLGALENSDQELGGSLGRGGFQAFAGRSWQMCEGGRR